MLGVFLSRGSKQSTGPADRAASAVGDVNALRTEKFHVRLVGFGFGRSMQPGGSFKASMGG
jgi:hypothetical protein